MCVLNLKLFVILDLIEQYTDVNPHMYMIHPQHLRTVTVNNHFQFVCGQGADLSSNVENILRPQAMQFETTMGVIHLGEVWNN